MAVKSWMACSFSYLQPFLCPSTSALSCFGPWSLMDLARGEDALAVAQVDEVEDHIKLENLLSNILMGSI